MATRDLLCIGREAQGVLTGFRDEGDVRALVRDIPANNDMDRHKIVSTIDTGHITCKERLSLSQSANGPISTAYILMLIRMLVSSRMLSVVYTLRRHMILSLKHSGERSMDRFYSQNRSQV